MDATGRINPTKSSDSSPKTTTWGSLIKGGLFRTSSWGALIVLSLLAAAFGFRGSFSSSHIDSTAQTEARLESLQLPSAQNPAQAAPQSAYSAQQSRVS